ncbi:MAG: hypothetical protein RLZ35_1269 [Pseudomonadota bacterium]
MFPWVVRLSILPLYMAMSMRKGNKHKTYRHALVTGASGFIGRVLCHYLLEQGVQVTAISRTSCPMPTFSADQYVSHRLDICKNSLPEAWWKGVDIVFHLAGVAHAGKASQIPDSEYQSVNVEATDALLAQAVLHNVKRFIYFSSVKAIEPLDRYGESKRLAENTVLTYGAQKAIKVSIVRPALVYGPQLKGNLQALQKAIQKGWFPPLPETGNRRSLISVQDLVHAAWTIAVSPRTYNKVYTVTDGIGYSTRQIYEVLSRLSGKKPRFGFIPKWVFWLITTLLRKSATFEKLFGSAFYPDIALSQDTGWEPRYSLWDIEQWNSAFHVPCEYH